MIRANVQDQTITLRYDDVISDSNRFLEIEFTFSSAWQSKTKVIVFKNSDTELNVILLDGNSMYLGNNRCYVPSEVIKYPGFSVSVYGVENNVLITTNEATVSVERSGIDNFQPAEPTPTLWNQILLAVNPAARVPNGGSSGQFLKKNSNSDYDVSWGDIHALTHEEAEIYYVPKTLKINNKPLNSDIELEAGDIGAYSLPNGGIPKEDLSSEVNASLSKADTALQEHQSLSSKQDVLESGTNIKTINNNSLLGSGNINITGTLSPIDEVIWRAPKDFGETVGETVGSNVKVYRDMNDEILVFLGSGKTYGSDTYNDSYIRECLCGNGNTTVRKVYIQNGITSIGANIFNRFYSADTSYGADKNWNVKSPSNAWSGVGVVTSPFIIPPSVTSIGKRAFQYCNIAETLIIQCPGTISIGQEAFNCAGFISIYIREATQLTGYNINTFLTPALRNFEVSCELKNTVAFSLSNNLTLNSLLNIANHLWTVPANNQVPKTILLHSTSKSLCNSTKGVVEDGEFIQDSSGSVTLTDFITNTKGWTIA